MNDEELKMENGPVLAVCDVCGRPIRFGNRPDGTPNGVTFKDCMGVEGNDMTLCADCLAAFGREAAKGGAE